MSISCKQCFVLHIVHSSARLKIYTYSNIMFINRLSPEKRLGSAGFATIYTTYLSIAHFIKPYRDPYVFVNWISARSYEMDCISLNTNRCFESFTKCM